MLGTADSSPILVSMRDTAILDAFRGCHEVRLLLQSRRPAGRGTAGPEQRRRRRIAGTRQTGSGRDNASGYAAGFSIVIPILLGAALGYAVGLLVGSELLLLPLGALAGLVLGFYAVYVRFIR